MKANQRDNYILILASWYPNRIDPLSGIFIKQLAEKLAQFKRIVILHITSDPGMVNNTFDLAESSESGVQSVLVYWKPSRNPLIRLLRYRRASQIGYRQIMETAGIPSLVHVQILSRYEWVPKWLHKRHNIPFIVTEHWSGYLTGEYKSLSPIRKQIIRSQFRRAKKIIVVSRVLQEAMQEQIPSLDFTVIQNLVEIDSHMETKPEKDPHKGKITILNIADLRDTKKNISGLIKAMVPVSAHFPAAELHIIGDGSDRQMLISLADSLGLLDKHVFFDGIFTHAETMIRMANASFYVCPSYVETFSIATAEALLCGLPVVATNCGGPGEFVTAETGYLIPPNDQDALEQAVIKMCGQFQYFDKEGIRSYARHTFNPEKLIQDWIALYNEITNSMAQ